MVTTAVTASVNLSTERAYISAPATVSAQDLAVVIQAAGYTAELLRFSGSVEQASSAAGSLATSRIQASLACTFHYERTCQARARPAVPGQRPHICGSGGGGSSGIGGGLADLNQRRASSRQCLAGAGCGDRPGHRPGCSLARSHCPGRDCGQQAT
jgi:hypothetical protein